MGEIDAWLCQATYTEDCIYRGCLSFTGRLSNDADGRSVALLDAPGACCATPLVLSRNDRDGRVYSQPGENVSKWETAREQYKGLMSKMVPFQLQPVRLIAAVHSMNPGHTVAS